MWRLVFPVLILSLLFVLIPFVSRTSPSAEAVAAFDLADPQEHLDVHALARSRNRPLRLASGEEIQALERATIADLVTQVIAGSDRERRLAGAALGASGHPDGVAPLILAFEREADPRTLASLALALAESRRSEAVAALVRAIRDREGLAAYEACRALKLTFGINLGLDADGWERWFEASQATRD